jgi:very-short-patch-repair endonuclease
MYYGANSSTLRAAAILRKSMTLAEAVLWKRLRDRTKFNTKFRKQHPIFIFVVDFYCHEHKLVIEVDGDIHNDKMASEYDLNRTAELNKFGIKVIRFKNDQVLYSLDSVLEKIQREITERIPPKREQGGLPQESTYIQGGSGA